MKKSYTTSRGYILAAGLFVGVLWASSTTMPVFAACTKPATTYGEATLQLTVPTTGSYRIWTRMQAPDATNNAVMLEVDGGTCYTVGNTAIPQKTWSWVGHQNGNTSSAIIANLTAGNHTLKVIGIEPAVKMDRILAVANQQCVPTGFGENCMETSDTSIPQVSITTPADGAAVSGLTTIKAAATDDKGVNKVEFYVQNQLVATKTSAPYEYSWDTTGKSGAYTIAVKAHDAVGNVGNDTVTVTVKNGDTKAPTIPLNLTGIAGADNTVELTWGSSTDDTAVKGYRVLRDNIVIGTSMTTSYTDQAVVPGITYRYSVIAFDESNNLSGPSNVVSITIPASPVVDAQAPTSPAELRATVVSANQINLVWLASTDNIAVKNYDIYRTQGEGSAIKVATVTTTSYGDTSLAASTAYEYYVIANDATGNASAASGIVRATTSASNESQATGVLRGKVEGRNGRPLAGVRVTVWVNGTRYRATTNWRGKYVVTNLPAGTHHVHFAKRDYNRVSKDVRLEPSKTKWLDVTMRRQ